MGETSAVSHVHVREGAAIVHSVTAHGRAVISLGDHRNDFALNMFLDRATLLRIQQVIVEALSTLDEVFPPAA